MMLRASWILFCPFLLVAILEPVVAEEMDEDYGDTVFAMPCPDTLGLRHKFLEGNLEEVYATWKSYLSVMHELRASTSVACRVQASKMLGVLDLVLRNDSVEADLHFYMVARHAPFVEMWDFSLPLSVQTAWDSARINYGPVRSPQKIWEDKWLPPVSTRIPLSPESMELKQLYHDSRVLYALARDPDYYVRIMQNIHSEDDPAFQLLRADVMLRLGYGISKAEKELGTVGFRPSLVLAPYHIFGWQDRLYQTIKGLKTTVDPKPETTPRGKSEERSTVSKKKKKF